MLKLVVLSASNLRNVDSIGKSDPYVKAIFRGKRVMKNEMSNSAHTFRNFGVRLLKYGQVEQTKNQLNQFVLKTRAKLGAEEH